MQIAPDRVSAIDAEVSYSCDREYSFRTEDFPKGILLPGLPLHLGEGWRSITPPRRLGDFFLGIRQRPRCNPRGRRDALCKMPATDAANDSEVDHRVVHS